jgi:chromosome segregation ATPase
MTLDEIPDQLQELFDRSRAVLDAQITKARKVVDNLNAEKTGAAKALADLKDQCRQTQANLDTVLASLNRASGLAGLDYEIDQARKILAGLDREKAEASKSLEASKKQLSDAETRFNALQTETQTLVAQRCDSQAIMENIRAQLRSMQLGQWP